jgi:hypothetical protein
LTCDFWAENAERKIKAKATAIKSVASPFGLRSSLRQSGRPLRGWARRGAEAPLYPKDKSKGKDKGRGKAKAKADLF